jgi:2-polyprenyl-6-methoxyphenol hydroxylase-like FAD-dependent oxidoreductase
VFGPENEFEKRLGYRVATCTVSGYRPRDELVYVAHASPGRQFARIALRDDLTVFLFVFRPELIKSAEPKNLAETRTVLREIFQDMGWESPKILNAMEQADEIYFDRVSQIKMPAWSKGPVILIGDAACAVSLLAGEGTGLALTEAYVLAGELSRAADYPLAFRQYEARMRNFVSRKQASAEKFAKSFVPKTQLGVWFRNQVTLVMRLPWIADFLIRRSVNVVDDFDLPTYEMFFAHSGAR